MQSLEFNFEALVKNPAVLFFVILKSWIVSAKKFHSKMREVRSLARGDIGQLSLLEGSIKLDLFFFPARKNIISGPLEIQVLDGRSAWF